MIKLSTATSRFIVDTCVVKLKGTVTGINCHRDWTNGCRGCLEGWLISWCNIYKTSVSRTNIRNIETTRANLWKIELCKLAIHMCKKRIKSLSCKLLRNNGQTTFCKNSITMNLGTCSFCKNWRRLNSPIIRMFNSHVAERSEKQAVDAITGQVFKHLKKT